jgi:hypothetical protein
MSVYSDMSAHDFLSFLATEYLGMHHYYESLFRKKYMGDVSCIADLAQARARMDAFKANSDYHMRIRALLEDEEKRDPDSSLVRRLGHWDYYFSLHALSHEAKKLKQDIDEREESVQTAMANVMSGYIDPYTGEFHHKTWS